MSSKFNEATPAVKRQRFVQERHCSSGAAPHVHRHCPACQGRDVHQSTHNHHHLSQPMSKVLSMYFDGPTEIQSSFVEDLSDDQHLQVPDHEVENTESSLQDQLKGASSTLRF